MIESPEDRARGQTSKPEKVTLQMVMEALRQYYGNINKLYEKQDKQLEESFRRINENLDKQLEKSYQSIHEKLDNNTKELTLLRTEIRGYTNALKADSSEIQRTQEEVVNENYEDVKKVQDTENTVDLTDVSDIKKLSTMGSNANVISKPRKKWIKKRNDFVSRYLAISEDDPDMD